MLSRLMVLIVQAICEMAEMETCLKSFVAIYLLSSASLFAAEGFYVGLNLGTGTYQDAELERWHFEIDEVERKVEFIDRALFEPGSSV